MADGGAAKQEKVALITGCSSGVGYALALQMAKNGYRTYATMRNVKKGEALLKEGEKWKDNLFVVALDVTDDKSISDAVETIQKKWGRIDVLVNNAGYAEVGNIEMVSVERAKVQFDTNFFGVMRVCQKVLPIMRKQRSGNVVMVSSIGGVWGQPMNDIYCASKFALT
eukprot:UN05755